MTHPESELASSNNVFAVEGVNGSGKTHTLELLSNKVTEEGHLVKVTKIAGLGDSRRVSCLKEILYSREEQRRKGLQTERQKDDHRRQRLFRLATRHQSALFLKYLGTAPENTLHLLDRTPLMTLAFCLSEDPENPYIPEIEREALELTKVLGIQKVFLLDVNPSLAIARTIARSVVHNPDCKRNVDQILEIMAIPLEMRDEIWAHVQEILTKQENLLPKPFSLWDYNDFRVTINESFGYRKALEIASEKIGQAYEVISTDKPVESVVALIRSRIIIK